MELESVLSSYIYSIPVRKTLDVTAAATSLYQYWQTKDWLFAEVAIVAALDLAGNTYEALKRFPKVQQFVRDYLRNTGVLTLGLGVCQFLTGFPHDGHDPMEYFALGSVFTALSTSKDEMWTFQKP
jgi:hypothetical protein